MPRNMGIIDRVIRVIIAAAIALLIIFNVINGPLAIVLGVLGGIFLVTSVIGFCPLYFPFKLSTRKK